MANIKDKNSTCIICGQKYHLCIACERKHANWKPWRAFVDKENCYNIYKILNDYNYNKITKVEARKLLSEVDLSKLDTFKERIKAQINEILKVEKISRPCRSKKNKIEEQQEEVVEEIVEIEIENKVEEKQLDDLIVE